MIVMPDGTIVDADHVTHVQNPPPHWIVAMIEFDGTVFVATERMVYRMREGKFVPVVFVSPEEGMASG